MRLDSTTHFVRTAAVPLAMAMGVLVALCPCVARAASLSPSQRRIVEEVRRESPQFVSELEELVRIDSTTENLPGVHRVGDRLARSFQAIGFRARWVEVPPSIRRAGHLLVEHDGNTGAKLLLIGHLDTVLPARGFIRKEGIGYGSGVSDIKGGDLVILYALKALQTTGHLKDARLAAWFSGDEEDPADDLDADRGELVRLARTADAALAFEAAYANTVTVARRGVSFWTLGVQSPSGHSSMVGSASSGAGSAYEMARILEGFRTLMETQHGLTINPALSGGGADATCSGDHLEAFGKPNVIAARTFAVGDLRFLNQEQLARAKEAMRRLVAEHLARASATITFADRYPAMAQTSGSNALLAEFDHVSRDLGYPSLVPCDPMLKGAGDISFVAPYLPCLDGLGVRGDGEHTVKESIDLKTVPEIIERTALLIYRLTRGRAEPLKHDAR